jgi:carbon monoxide dehydrogenase subunit G
MNLTWDGEENIPAAKATVWAFINDPAKIAGCLPDVESTTITGANTFDAVVRVALGPVRGKFNFKIALEPRADGNHMDMKVSGGGLGSVVDMVAGADLTPTGDSSTTLKWHGDASIRGPAATVGGRVLDTQAHRVIGTTFENVKKHLTASV